MTDERTELINGTVKRVVFSRADSAFSVIELVNGDGTETVVGELPDVAVGEELEITGKYVVHPVYGSQFKAEVCVKVMPSGAAAIMRYLSSGVIKGIGPATAKRIVQNFGDGTFDVIENEPERLAKIKGITYDRAMQLSEEIKNRRSLREVCLKLSRFGLSADDAVSAIGVLGDTAAEQIEQNPYLLCKKGIDISFEKADDIAGSIGIARDDLERLCAGVLYVVRHNLQNGHTCLPEKTVLGIAAKLLDCDSRAVDDACALLCERGELTALKIGDTPFYSVTEIYDCERYIATRLSIELSLPQKARAVTEKEINAAGMRLGIIFEGLQREAIALSVTSGVFILTGGPGTGKTTTVNGIIEVMENRGMKVSLAAPTGRAAKRMTELTGREAKTVHRLLEVGTTDDKKEHVFVKNERNPIDADAVIIDEMSMVDAALFDALLRALKLGTRIVLVGDSDQLPSVGAGNVLKDMLSSGKFASVRLCKVFRQALSSMIVVNAHRIINGEPLLLDSRDGDFFMLDQTVANRAVRLVSDLCCRRLPAAYGFSPLQSIQVLCPSKKMELGTVNLNNILQEQLNPPADDLPEIAFKGFTLRRGDKVMQIKNNYDIVWEDDAGSEGTGVFNGDVGILEDIDVRTKEVSVRFSDRVARYLGDEVTQLEPAYAVTVHKSQGSEFDCVILPLLDFPYQLKYRNLLYTAVTRAKRLLVVVGSREVLASMAANEKKTMRYTALKSMLTEDDEA